MRVDNVPAELLDEAVREQLFGRDKPYGMPTAGYADDVKKLGVTDLAAFYRRFYAPNNAVLIVAGDTIGRGGAQACREILRPDSRSRRRAAPAAGRRRGGPAAARDPGRCAGCRTALDARFPRAVLSRWARRGTPMRCWCWRGCSAAARPAACRQALVADAKLALSASAGYGASSLGLSSFEISVHPAPQRSVAEIEGAVADQMKKVLDGDVTAEEVERAQNQLLASAIYSQDSLAQRPAPLRLDPVDRRHDRRHRRLAAAHRRGAARRCRGRRPPCLARRRRGDVAADAGRGQPMRMRLALLVACAIGLTAARAGAVEVKEVTTPLGIKAWLVEDKSTPVVALSFSFASGSASRCRTTRRA